MKIRLANPLQQDSIVDGEGIRMVVWTQGCSHNCKGCHNPNTHSFEGGFIKDIDELKEEIKDVLNHDGITFSGGDPFFQIESCLEIAKYGKSLGLNIWCYTGFTFEELMIMKRFNKHVLEFLKNIDVLIDGRFIEEEKDLTLKFRGSKNQRILNVKDSLRKEKPVWIKKYKSESKKDKKNEHLFV
jgi:anaerobic ribonucleoside-triphosphate reductase activating protein